MNKGLYMMMKLARYAIPVFLMTIAFGYNNCTNISFSGGNHTLGSAGETVLGNPMTTQNLAQQVALALCQVVSTCAPNSSPVSSGDCYAHLQPVTNMVALLGAPAQTYSTFGGLISANLAGAITGNTAAASVTVNQILAESCGSSTVQNIFSSGQASYSNIAGMVPASSVSIFRPTAIYRSVGPGNTSALATGTSNALTISGTTATFASALPNNVGVGDALQYQVGGVWNLAFITGRISSTAYFLQTASGGIPTATAANSSWSFFRAYTSLANAVDVTLGGTENTGINAAVRNFDTWVGGTNLVSTNQIWNFALYADAPDSSVTNISGWVTSAANYLKVYAPFLSTEVGVTQRHSGAWDTTKAMMTYSNMYNPFVVTNDVWIDGLQFQNNASGSGDTSALISVLPSTSTTTKISNNLITEIVTATGAHNTALQLAGTTAGATYLVWNNILSGVSGGFGVAIGLNSHGTAYIYNNTVYGSDTSYAADGFGGGALTFVLKNNIAQHCLTSCFTVKNGAAFSPSSDYNDSGDDTSTGGSHDLLESSDIFVSAGALNFLLSTSDTTAKGAGKDLSLDPNLPILTDVSNITRTDPWDIGASTPH